MIKIITPRQTVETTSTSHSFSWMDDTNSGFGFTVDADGRAPADMCDVAAVNYYKCLTGQHAVIDNGIETYVNRYIRPAVGRCPCGESVSLGNFTNTCDCGTDYNSSGQLLASREEWGEETGESVSDILNIK